MIGLVPKPLGEDFREVLVAVARDLRLATLDEPDRLAPRVAALAEAYNHPTLSGLAGVDHRAARLSFWLPRDVPKVEGAVREAVAIGRIGLRRQRTLRVLDLGAGLGASHRGLARALAAAGQRGTLDIDAVDADAAALSLGEAIHARRPREGNVELRLRSTRADKLPTRAEAGSFDVVLLGQVLTELDLALAPAERLEKHRALVQSLLAALVPSGVLVIVEPALRPRARHLQALRGALLADARVRVIGPCLHHGACPMLGREGDWCHEDLAVDLPEWLVPIARRAGLRWEGLTYAHLLLGLGLQAGDVRAALEPAKGVVRAVSAPIITKGKLELLVCGDRLRASIPEGDPHGEHGARLGRLDREASKTNDELAVISRGEVIVVDPPLLDEKQRVGRDGHVRRATVAATVDASSEPDER